MQSKQFENTKMDSNSFLSIFILKGIILPYFPCILFLEKNKFEKPTLTVEESPSSAAVKPSLSIFITAKSVCSSVPTIVPSYAVSSLYK